MLKHLIPILVILPLAGACSPSWPEPKQPMIDAEAASRSAHELGADTQPEAKLKVTLADEQIAEARRQMAKGDNRRANYLLIRAKADAELAVALAREQQALAEKQQAAGQSQPAPGATGVKP
jgi:hypothetical protein